MFGTLPKVNRAAALTVFQDRSVRVCQQHRQDAGHQGSSDGGVAAHGGRGAAPHGGWGGGHWAQRNAHCWHACPGLATAQRGLPAAPRPHVNKPVNLSTAYLCRWRISQGVMRAAAASVPAARTPESGSANLARSPLSWLTIATGIHDVIPSFLSASHSPWVACAGQQGGGSKLGAAPTATCECFKVDPENFNSKVVIWPGYIGEMKPGEWG